MGEKRVPWVMAAIGLLLGLAVVFLWDDLIAPGLGLTESSDAADLAERYRIEDAEHLAELRARAGMRELPGVERRADGTGVLRGKIMQYVRGGEPRPLAGVEVHAVGLHRNGQAEKYTLESGPDGVFQRTDAPALFGYVLTVRHTPFREKRLKGISVQRDRVTDVGVILLGAPTTLTGEVRTAQGGPPVGAVVQVLPDRSRSDSFDLRAGLFELQSAIDFLAEARADRDGRFTIKDLPPGRYVLRVSAPGYATSFRSGVIVTVDERSAEPRITLDKGAGYEGKVLDEEGRGIADAHVLAVAAPGAGTSRIERVDVRSGADGSYRLDTLTPGVRYFIEAWADGYAPAGQFPVVGEGVTKKDFTLSPAGRIEGRITDERTGEALAGVEVTLAAGSFVQMSPVSTITDRDGYYAFPHVSAGPLLLFSAKADGYQQVDQMDLAGVKQGEARVKVKSGETTVLDMALPRGGLVEGRVTTTRGEPVPYVTVGLLDRRRRWAGEATGLTDQDGRYRIDGLRPAEYDLRITAPGYAPVTDDAKARVVVPDSLEATLKDVVLEEGATLYGTVKTPEGAPQGGAVLTVKAVGGKREVRDRVRDLVAVSTASGAYTLKGIPPNVSVVVVAEHDVYVRTESAPQRLTPGLEKELALVLRAGASITGRAVDQRGNPVAEARVRWGNVDDAPARRLRNAWEADEYLGPRVLYADADGRFTIPNVAPGKTLVKVQKAGYGDWYRHDIVVGTEGAPPALTVELFGALAIEGRVVSDRSGAPIADAIVYCRERGAVEGEDDPGKVKALATAHTNARGFYRLEGLAPGRYRVVVWFADGYQGRAIARDEASNRQDDVEAGTKGVGFRLKPIEAPSTGD
ncbi:MAG: carboxypeptidase regulatory-like domain-containing protein [Planctomycetota bacterium]|nr:carboxypeptidase regulatory-like domain-containing protein [Planctomycetota bacterium]